MLNRCDFIGRLGADPDIRHTQDGKPVANLSLAVTERWRDKNTGEQKENTDWIRCVAFGGLASVAQQYLTKGALVYVSGKLTLRKWQDQEGKDRWTTEIVLSGFDGKLRMLGGGSTVNNTPDVPAPEDDAEIPF